ncbi:hypothetical protein BD410DRAFT_31663 [Rickenella mellea]|uniref:MARVEL domain-containing protein n=1 Tax=Rickenella mellea TaxID=50990 RepID=A0A4R5XEX2_9AGAM|nr:hypothetical protein BD410DRAFT_31663 [Rickenella mellea]
MTFLNTLRLLTFGTSLGFSVIILGLCANILSLTLNLNNRYFVFSAFGLAIGILTVLFLLPMLVIDLTRKGPMTSWIVVELPVLSVLWVLWLAVAADAVSDVVASDLFSGSCDYLNSKVNTVCNSYKAIEAFGFLTWLILMAYTIVLLVFACISQSRGNKAVWTSSVRDTDFLAYPNGKAAPSMNQYTGGSGAAMPMPPQGHAYPPNGQQMPVYQNTPTPPQGMPYGGQVTYPQA